MDRQRVIPLAVRSETRWVEFAVTSPWSGAGEAVADTTDSTEVTLRNIGAHPFEYRVDNGQWQRLELRNSHNFLVSLASSTIRVRRSQFGGDGMARLEIQSLTTAYVADGHEVSLGDGGGSSERPPAPYAVGAVQLDKAYEQRVASLSCVNSALISFSFWIRLRNGYGQRPICESTTVANEEEELTLQTAELKFNDNRFFVWLGDGNDPGNQGENTEAVWAMGPYLSETSRITDNEWHHVLGAVKTDLPNGQKIVVVYIDDEPYTMEFSSEGNSFVPALSGRPFQVGGSPGWDKTEMDLAEFWFAVGQTLLVDSDIPQATRRKFIDADGWPVNLGTNGQTPTGTAPTVFLRHAADNSVGFLTNQGTGGGPFVAGGEGGRTVLTETPSDPQAIFHNPLIKTNDMIIGTMNGTPGRLAAPSNSGTWVLHCVNGSLTWVPVP